MSEAHEAVDAVFVSWIVGLVRGKSLAGLKEGMIWLLVPPGLGVDEKSLIQRAETKAFDGLLFPVWE